MGDVGICQLCAKSAELQNSHILPSFVYKDFKKTSATGRIRATNVPNLLIEDGVKEPLLCWDCEQRFCKWEGMFRNHVFIPFHRNKRLPLIYGPWLEKFAVSVSWRVLLFHKLFNGLEHVPTHLMPSINEALTTWKDYLLGVSKSAGRFEQHLLPFSPVVATDVLGLSPYLNRYLLGTIDLDVVQAGDTAIVYSKLRQLAILGFIQKPADISWAAMRISPGEGKLEPKNLIIPEGFLWYLSGKAEQAHRALKSLSPKQRQNMQEAMRKNKDRVSQSDILQALKYDVRLFGKELAVKGSNRTEQQTGLDQAEAKGKKPK